MQRLEEATTKTKMHVFFNHTQKCYDQLSVVYTAFVGLACDAAIRHGKELKAAGAVWATRVQQHPAAAICFSLIFSKVSVWALRHYGRKPVGVAAGLLGIALYHHQKLLESFYTRRCAACVEICARYTSCFFKTLLWATSFFFSIQRVPQQDPSSQLVQAVNQSQDTQHPGEDLTLHLQVLSSLFTHTMQSRHSKLEDTRLAIHANTAETERLSHLLLSIPLEQLEAHLKELRIKLDKIASWDGNNIPVLVETVSNLQEAQQELDEAQQQLDQTTHELKDLVSQILTLKDSIIQEGNIQTVEMKKLLGQVESLDNPQRGGDQKTPTK